MGAPEGGPLAAGGEVGPGGQVLAQTMVKGGEASNRLMFQQEVGAPPEEGG